MTKPLFPDSPPRGASRDAPLAERMRPVGLSEVVGQQQLVGEGMVLREMIRQDRLVSLLFWGPPGTGKTTLARIIAAETRSTFLSFSAVLSGIKEVKSIMSEAEAVYRNTKQRTILFIDEIHRFNKAQQDAFLPYIESGVIVLIGATTENPSFEVIGPLLSRVKVYVLNPLATEEIEGLLKRAVRDQERGFGAMALEIEEGVLGRMAAYANGDARTALNSLELSVLHSRSRSSAGNPVLTLEDFAAVLQRRIPRYDKSGDEHYNLISALHKSMRNSDPDAALYWLGRMLEAGEDPLYIARRMVRFASEDIGLADIKALTISLDATEALRLVGLPEGKLALAQAAIYLSLAPKSNAVYRAYSEVQADIQNTINEPPPLDILNAPTQLMRELGYGRGYQYAHDLVGKVADMECLPASLAGKHYYRPSEQGMERRIKEVLEQIKARKKGS